MTVVLAVVLLLWMLGLERRRSQPRSLSLGRALATLLWVVALALLILRPGSIHRREPQTVLVATSGATPALLRQAAGHRPLAAAFRLDDDATVPAPLIERLPGLGRWRTTTDLAALVRGHPEVARLVVVGHGLPPWTPRPAPRPVLLPAPVVAAFLPPPLAPGVQDITWNRRPVLGQPVVVEGVLSAATPRPGTLRLLDDGGVADQWPVAARAARADTAADASAAVPFVLRSLPRTAGRHRLRLRYQADSTLPAPSGAASVAGFEEQLGVSVTPPSGLAVLWLATAPSFEVRHLHQWLTAQDGSMVVRTGLTGNRRRVALFGRHAETLAAPGFGRLSAALLAGFDVVVLDVGTVTKLARAERAALEAAVVDRGLGVLLRLAEADVDAVSRANPPNGRLRFGPRVEEVADLDTLEVRLAWPGTTLAVPLSVGARQLLAGPGVEPLAHDQAGRLLVAARISGRGAIGWSLVAGTYRWVLGGHGEHHRAFWSHVLGRLARPPRTVDWLLPSGPLLADQPMVVHFTVSVEPRSLAVGNPEQAYPVAPSAPMIEVRGPSSSLRLVSRRVGENAWAIDWWPRAAGWHALRLVDQDVESVPLALEVQPATSWKIWRQAQRQRATAGLVAAGILGDGAGLSEGLSSKIVTGDRGGRFTPWSRGWGFGMFLLAAGYLWLDERRARHRAPER